MLWGMGPRQAFGKSFFDRKKSLESAFKLCRFERLSSQVPGLIPACGHHRHVSESDTSTLPCIQYHVHWNGTCLASEIDNLILYRFVFLILRHSISFHVHIQWGTRIRGKRSRSIPRFPSLLPKLAHIWFAMKLTSELLNAVESQLQASHWFGLDSEIMHAQISWKLQTSPQHKLEWQKFGSKCHVAVISHEMVSAMLPSMPGLFCGASSFASNVGRSMIWTSSSKGGYLAWAAWAQAAESSRYPFFSR